MTPSRSTLPLLLGMIGLSLNAVGFPILEAGAVGTPARPFDFCLCPYPEADCGTVRTAAPVETTAPVKIASRKFAREFGPNPLRAGKHDRNRLRVVSTPIPASTDAQRQAVMTGRLDDLVRDERHSVGLETALRINEAEQGLDLWVALEALALRLPVLGWDGLYANLWRSAILISGSQDSTRLAWLGRPIEDTDPIEGTDPNSLRVVAIRDSDAGLQSTSDAAPTPSDASSVEPILSDSWVDEAIESCFTNACITSETDCWSAAESSWTGLNRTMSTDHVDVSPESTTVSAPTPEPVAKLSMPFLPLNLAELMCYFGIAREAAAYDFQGVAPQAELAAPAPNSDPSEVDTQTVEAVSSQPSESRYLGL